MDLPESYRRWICEQGHTWDWFLGASFKDPRRVPSAEKSIKSWLEAVSDIALDGDGRLLPCVYSVEYHRSGFPHVHAVVAGVSHLGPAGLKKGRSLWVRSRGLAKLKPYNPSLDGLGYVLKSASDPWSLVGFSSEVFASDETPSRS